MAMKDASDLADIAPLTASIIASVTNTVQLSIDVGINPLGITYDPQNNDLYVANLLDQKLSVIDSDTNTVIEEIGVGNGPRMIAYNEDNMKIYVTNRDDNTVSVI